MVLDHPLPRMSLKVIVELEVRYDHRDGPLSPGGPLVERVA